MLKKLAILIVLAALAMPSILVAQDTGSLGSEYDQYKKSGELLGDNRNAAEEIVQVWNGLAVRAHQAVDAAFAGEGSFEEVRNAESQLLDFERSNKPRFPEHHFVMSRLNLATAFFLRGEKPKKCESALRQSRSELRLARNLVGEKGATPVFLESLDAQERVLNQIETAPGGGCAPPPGS